MRVGLNLLYLLPGEVGGTQTYAEELVGALVEVAPELELVAFVNRESAGMDLARGSDLRTVVCELDASSRPRRYLFEQLRLPRLAEAHGVDLLHSLGYVGPLRPGRAHVVTVHDLIYVGFGPHMPRSKRIALRTFVRASARRADRVITDSGSSRAQLIADIGLLDRCVEVIPLAARSDLDPSGAPPPGLPERYVLAFGSPSPTKNLPRLVEAFALSGAARTHHLVLAGHLPPDDSVRTAIAAAGVQRRVHLTGYVADAAVGPLMAGADLLAFPSTYEGFGMPVLDAQCLGVPVVCSDAASLPEVAGQGARLFDPRSVADMAAAIASVLADATIRAELVAAGRSNAARLTWRSTARRTLEVYRSVLAERGLL